jgi:hypothetical protein
MNWAGRIKSQLNSTAAGVATRRNGSEPSMTTGTDSARIAPDWTKSCGVPALIRSARTA